MAVKKIGLYKKPTFSKKNRIVWYKKMPRNRRPEFVIIGIARSKGGRLRYKVRDVNHKSKTYGLIGYITARKAYVKETYYQSMTKAKTKKVATKTAKGKTKYVLKKQTSKTKTVTIINPKGVNSYKSVNLTGEVKHYRQGQKLTIKRVVHYHATTRFVLSDGTYITANKQLVRTGAFTHAKYVTVKTGVNLYKDYNLQTKAGHHYTAKTKIKILGWDYSDNGTLRYRVAGGYITANSLYVYKH